MTNLTTIDFRIFLNYTESSNNLSSRKRPEYYLLAKAILPYAWAVLLLMGSIGNCLTIAVMIRPKLRENLTSLLFMALAVADQMVLIFGPFLVLLTRLPPSYFSFKNYSDWSCKLNRFIFHLSSQCASWILLIITCERFLAVLFPVRYKQWISRIRGMVIVLVTVSISALANIHYVFTQARNNGRCATTKEAYYFVLTWLPWIEILMTSIIPASLIFSGNICILVRIFHAKYEAEKQMNIKQSTVNTTSLTLMLLSTSFIYMLTTLPRYIYQAIQMLIWTENSTADAGYKYRIINDYSYVLLFFNSAINFWIYIFSGARFRTEFLIMIRIKSGRNT